MFTLHRLATACAHPQGEIAVTQSPPTLQPSSFYQPHIDIADGNEYSWAWDMNKTCAWPSGLPQPVARQATRAKERRFDSVMCPWRQGCSGLQESCHGLEVQGATTTRAACQVRQPTKAVCGIVSNTGAVGGIKANAVPIKANAVPIKANAVEASAAAAQGGCSCGFGEGPAGPASSSAASSSGACR